MFVVDAGDGPDIDNAKQWVLLIEADNHINGHKQPKDSSEGFALAKAFGGLCSSSLVEVEDGTNSSG